MLITNLLYKKVFSKLENIQESQEILYNLCEDPESGGKGHGIQIISKNTKGIQSRVFEKLSDSEDVVKNIITYLYENSVKIESAEYIIQDVLERWLGE